jgi:hypothetical protein
VAPPHVATWIEAQTREIAAPTVKQRLAAIRHPFDWPMVGQVVPVNPAASVPCPQLIVTRGKAPHRHPLHLGPNRLARGRRNPQRLHCGSKGSGQS